MAKAKVKIWNIDGTIKFTISAQGIEARNSDEAKAKAEEPFSEVFIDFPDRLAEILQVSQVSPYETEIDSVEEDV